MMKKILFLCTGNYYRSRFAEALFNFWAENNGSGFRAVSRGLHIKPGKNEGPISKDALKPLEKMKILYDGLTRKPQEAKDSDFEDAFKIIALKKSEHQPIVINKFPVFADQVEYWDAPDVPPSFVYDPLAEIKELTKNLFESLNQK